MEATMSEPWMLEAGGEHGLGLGEVVEEVALAGHHLPVTNREDLDRGPLSLPVGGEKVPLLELGGGDLLGGLQALQGADLIAQAGRFLEAVPARRLLHLSPEPAHDFLRAPFQEQPRVVAGLAVAIEGADLGHAAGEAAL